MSEAPGLQPDMRAFVLWQASRGYRTQAPAKANVLLKNAFQAALYIDKGNIPCTHGEAELCGAKYWLQKAILRDLIVQSKGTSEIQPLLASAEPEVRQMLNSVLLHRYVRDKAFDRARSFLQSMSNENGYFSYGDATELIEALPRERSEDRSGVFSQAIQAYREHTDEKYPTADDPAIMVLRVWQDLPSSLVLSAIDEIFDRAKDVDERDHDIRIGLSTKKGDAHFSSVYQFRLYQLIPVLDQLDKAQAESLLGKNSEAQTALERYPRSFGSMSAPAGRDIQSNNRGVNADILGIGAQDVAHSEADENLYQIVRRQRQILSEAGADPKQALSDAMRLPLDTGLEAENNFRASTLNSVARIAALKNPAISRAALEEVRKIASDSPVRTQAQILAEVPEMYLRLGDESEARSSLTDLVKVAGKLYERDSDSDDPNQAFKGMWPSANLWRQCLAVAARLTPSPVQEIMEQIPDPEIKTFEKVAFANSLLGADFGRISTIEKHKNGIRASIGY